MTSNIDLHVRALNLAGLEVADDGGVARYFSPDDKIVMTTNSQDNSIKLFTHLNDTEKGVITLKNITVSGITNVGNTDLLIAGVCDLDLTCASANDVPLGVTYSIEYVDGQASTTSHNIDMLCINDYAGLSSNDGDVPVVSLLFDYTAENGMLSLV